MTLPNERRMAILKTEDFLKDLLDPSKTPRIPKEIRQRAYSCLRHFPCEYHMEQVKDLAPKIFGEWDSEYKDDVDVEHSHFYYDTERNR
jgi:hypothetical protein